MNRKNQIAIILIMLLGMTVLAACQDDGEAGPEATVSIANETNEASDETSQSEASGGTETDTVEREQFPDATAVPFSRTREEISAFPVSIAGKQVDDVANLSVTLSTASNGAPVSEADVMVFSDGVMVIEGQTSSGILRENLPFGTYDIAVRYLSTPPAGYLQTGIELTDTTPELVEFIVPDEGILEFKLFTDNGFMPGQEFLLTLAVADNEILSRRVRTRDEGSVRLNLRSDLEYDLEIEYPGQTLSESGISIRAEEEFLELSLPFSENTAEIYIRQNGAPLETNAFVTILDTQGGIVVARTAVNDLLSTLLPDNQEFTVRVELEGALTQEIVIQVPSDGLAQYTFNFDG